MSRFRTINYVDIPLGILQQITEEEVALWMAARMKQTQAEGMPVNAMTLSIAESCVRGEDLVADFSMHAAGKCGSGSTVCSALEELKTEVMGNPSRDAARKRAEARRLLDEADKLSALANGGTTV